ncbi:precorrin-6y C5,15-methyltransferase (decarboxylating) subunit CbiE [Roseibium polysiphoniae]|uniref:Precorrin-6y C5,15-methyltransferase (Decarboxylating) subunit CbiE n=1 Tax=Roseibium polysiphoniae TaxID=2571221 RepID=A0ABR9CH33_9HYPH|nr:precorrin-6y C5,15-methyltransferase (decarboxylating) subunit CbiE [Roseibium polysiphoniae]MBD8878406.1 precorrin-6y C5,15-methyltransferase (decarboxylating) subunit CbiE [Roseibium polysiphoniae]
MTAPWLSLIGIGEDGNLSEAARGLLANAKVVYGSERHFALGGVFDGEKRTWPNPFSNVYDELKALAGIPVVILATGDPQWYGIGSTLVRRFAREEMQIFTVPSAFQLAASRMHWPVQDVDCISLHGRPVENLRCFLYPGARILALTSNAETPQRVADILADAGFGRTRMTVLEHLGGTEERIVSSTAENWQADVTDFHTLALEVTADQGTRFLPRTPGLPDDAFRHDGKMTKREVRATTLAALMPHPGALLWDIGAGCGSIGIEWMRAARNAKAIGLEPHAERRAMALGNALALGVAGLEIRDACAPEALDDLPQPDAIFIGGGLTTDGIIDVCHNALQPGGRLVANAVTLEGEAFLLRARQHFGGELSRISIQRASPVGDLTGWRPLMPVTQWALVKGSQTSL